MAGSKLIAGFLIFLALVLPEAVVLCEFPATLTLERAFPPNRRVELSQLRARDMKRHGRMMQSSDRLQEMPLLGSYSPFLVGLYYTRIQLGSPPKEFYVQVDTGSDALWVNCNACKTCPSATGLKIPINFFNTASSSTASLISCSDQRCYLEGTQSSQDSCAKQKDKCGYSFLYGDGSGTEGYYVSDKIHFSTVPGNSSSSSNSSSSILFGCSTSRSGDLMKPERAVDGILGLGQRNISVISQLHSQGKTPAVFSHCLKGDEDGGGRLIFGEVVDANIVYTPLVQSMPHYNLRMQSIAVNGKKLPINPLAFVPSASAHRGTIVDSGTTLVYLAEEAYDPLYDAITGIVSRSPVKPFLVKKTQCYHLTTSLLETFPTLTLYFAGGANMTLKPHNYLVQHPTNGSSSVWCWGFQKSQGHGKGLTILGDLVLKDKIVVYDLERQRIGWANYNCSSPVSVSAPKNGDKSELVSASPSVFGSSSSERRQYMLIQSIIMAFLFHLSLFQSCSFL